MAGALAQTLLDGLDIRLVGVGRDLRLAFDGVLDLGDELDRAGLAAPTEAALARQGDEAVVVAEAAAFVLRLHAVLPDARISPVPVGLELGRGDASHQSRYSLGCLLLLARASRISWRDADVHALPRAASL